jgi:hypothetical protein
MEKTQNPFYIFTLYPAVLRGKSKRYNCMLVPSWDTLLVILKSFLMQVSNTPLHFTAIGQSINRVPKPAICEAHGARVELKIQHKYTKLKNIVSGAGYVNFTKISSVSKASRWTIKSTYAES